MLRNIFIFFMCISLFFSVQATCLATLWYLTERDGFLYVKAKTWPDEQSKIARSFQEIVDNICSDNDSLVLDGGELNKNKKYTLKLFGPLLLNKALTIRGALPTDPQYDLHGGETLLDGTGLSQPHIYVSEGVSGVSVSNITITNGELGIKTFGNSDVHDVKIDNTTIGIWSNSASKFSRLFLKNIYSHPFTLYGEEEITYSIIQGGKGLWIRAGSPIFKNVLIIGQQPHAVILVSNTHVELINSIILAYGTYWYNEYAIANDISATATLKNSLVLPNPKEPDEYYRRSELIEEVDCIHNSPDFFKARRPAIVIFGSDDAGNLEYFEQIVAKELEKYGWHGVMAYSHPSAASSADWALMKDLKARGHQIASHGDRFSRNVQNHKGILVKLKNSSMGSATISITGDASNPDYSAYMVLKINGNPDNTVNGNGIINFNEYNSLKQLCNFIDGSGCPNWGCELRGEQTAASKYLPELLDLNVPFDGIEIDLDSESVWKGEIRDPKLLFEKKLGPGYQHTGWVGPGNGTSPEMRAKLKEFGYKAARGGYPDRGSILLENFNVYNFWTHSLYGLFKTNEPSGQEIETKIGSQLEWIKYHGGVLYYYAHNTREFTRKAWNTLLSVVSISGVRVMTLEEAGNFVRTYNPVGDLHSEDGMVFKRSLLDNANYHLSLESPCINNGITWDNIEKLDFSSILLNGTPDIGPFEFPGEKIFLNNDLLLIIPCVQVNNKKYKVAFGLDLGSSDSNFLSWLLKLNSIEEIEANKCILVDIDLDLAVKNCIFSNKLYQLPMYYNGVSNHNYIWKTAIKDIVSVERNN